MAKFIAIFFALWQNFYMLLKRYNEDIIRKDLDEKMVFISGPRQVGKTTLARSFLAKESDRYYNWDQRKDRKTILAAQWPAGNGTIVLDEIHKYRTWKNWIKGEYDSHKNHLRFLITGSARMDIYRKGGDSLQGRYHSHHLHGFSIGELSQKIKLPVPFEPLEFPEKIDPDLLAALFHYGPFPEPFLKQDERALRRWRKEKLDRFFREDIRELENIRDLSSMELLVGMLDDRIGAPLSLQSLREDLEVSHKAATHWMDILERLYFCFRIAPFSHHPIRSLKKMPKVYLWDWSSVPDEGARYENLVAGHLLKLKHALEDQEGYSVSLWYLRDVSKREVDFLFTVEGKPWFAVECKKGGKASNASLIYFGARLKIPFLYQLTLEGEEDIISNNVRTMPAARFLAALP